MKLYTLCIVSAVGFAALVSAGTAAADPRGLWLAEDGAKVRVSSCGRALLRDISKSQIADGPGDGHGLDRQE